MPYIFRRGSTLLIPSGPPNDPDRLHLFIAVTDVCPDGDQLIAGISTIRGGYYDRACVIPAGAHPFIVSDSYAEYRYARRISNTHLMRMADKGLFAPRDDASPALVRSVRNGVNIPSTFLAVCEHTVSVWTHRPESHPTVHT